MFFVTFIKSIKIFRKPTHPPLPLREAPPLSPSPFSMVFTPPSVPPLAGDRNLREEEENRPTVLNFLPLRLSCKESSTSNQAFLLKRKDVTALRCSEPLRSKVGGPSKVFAIFCGMGPPGCCGGRSNAASKPSPCCAGWTVWE